MYVLLAKAEGTDPADPTLEVYTDEVFGSVGAAETAARDAWADGEVVLVGEVKAVDWDPPTCAHMTYAGSRHVDPEPPEYCENQTVPGTEYCSDHVDAE